MRTFSLASELSVPPERFWQEQMTEDSSTVRTTDSSWPRTVSTISRSLLVKTLSHDRTILKVGHGCKITDHVRLDPRFKFLSPWIKASYIMKFRREHQKLREAYGGKLPM
jgi:hypothetical protein